MDGSFEGVGFPSLMIINTRFIDGKGCFFILVGGPSVVLCNGVDV